MSLAKRIRDGIAQPRVAIYLKVMAVFMLLGALSHLGSILNISGTSWVARPPRLRVFETVLVAVNLALAWGLSRTRFWAVVGWVAAVVLLQFVPFLLFTEFFAPGPRERATVYSVLTIDVVLLGVFFLLLPRKKGS